MLIEFCVAIVQRITFKTCTTMGKPTNSKESANKGANEKVNFFDKFIEDNANSAPKSFDDILTELSVKDTCRPVTNLCVLNVVTDGCFEQKIDEVTRIPVTVFKPEEKRYVTFITDKKVIGMDYNGEKDDTGKLVRSIGWTNKISISYFALLGALKRTPETLVALPEIVADINNLNLYFAGGAIDILCEHVDANTPWHNPFASEQADTVVAEERVYHHITRLALGKLGNERLRFKITAQ